MEPRLVPTKVYEHHAHDDPERAVEVRVSTTVVRIICDAPGLASVSHVLSWGEWRELVAAVDASWPEAPIA